jgi:hypothetical protein
MATFLEVLPDPDFKITNAGIEDESTFAEPHPGFASLKLGAEIYEDKDRTISGKLIHRRASQSGWSIELSYNPLTAEELKPVKAFIMHRQTRGGDFYISLPQYKKPKDADFAAYWDGVTTTNITTTGAVSSGTTNMVVTHADWSGTDYSATGLPYFGDLFTIEDSEDSLHSKVYMVSRVETSAQFESNPGAGNIRIHFSPSLSRNVSSGSIINFSSPLMRVYLTGNTQEYKLGNDNLYAFSIKLKEALY